MDDETLRSLAAFPEQLERHYRLIPDAYKSWAPASWEGVPSEALTAVEQVWHVLDIEVDGYCRRFQRTLAEDDPLLEGLDTYALAGERRYKEKRGDEALRAFRQARSKTVELLSGLRTEQLARTARFEGYGNVTLHGLIHFLCSHDQQHLSGLQWLLGKIASESGSDAALRDLARAPGTRAEKARAAARMIRQLGSYRWAGLYDVSATEIAVIGWDGPEAPTFPSFPVTKGLNGAAVAEKKAVIVQDVANDSRYRTTIGGTRGEMIYPIIAPSGHTVGTIDVESDHINAFSGRDEELLAACARDLVWLWQTKDR